MLIKSSRWPISNVVETDDVVSAAAADRGDKAWF